MTVRRTLTAALVALLLPVVGSVASPAQEPLDVAVATTGATLQQQYATTRAAVREALAAVRPDDHRRVAALRRLARPERQLLAFSAAGRGQVVEVIGDLARARRIAVIVPGADHGVETYDGRPGAEWAAPGGAARALHAEIVRQDPRAPVAVVAWLGYPAPRTISAEVLTDATAVRAAERLRHLVGALRRVNGAEVALLCHSYGSVVCGHAAADLPVSDLVAYGSPGMGVAAAAELRTTARVWAGRGSADWIRHVPFLQLDLGAARLGFGPDPTSPDFGARAFPAAAAGHSDYLRPGSPSLRALARIAAGRAGHDTAVVSAA